MKLSVVTVCFNSEKTIGGMVESFLAQSYTDKELLIIDGSSKDATLEIIASFSSSDIRVISEKDAGVYDAMNKGLRLFSGDAVGFVNSDDAFHDENGLAAIAAGLRDADIAYGDLLMVADHQSKQVVREWRAGEFAPGAFQRGWQPPHPGFFVRREMVEKIGLFDLGYESASDYDFMLRGMLWPEARVSYVPQVIVDFQMGGVSTRDWRATLRGSLETLRSRQRHLDAPLIDAALFLRLVRRLFQLRRLGKYYGK